ncbi:sigma-70 family RNA polymerase sigma factor [Spirillospora sp. NPDC047279]|uniref:RNA polymerase sigma factor n=1 Tax=Spirillospora sp. NPDC047279 TaxID=3155478 RepID=UPI0033DF00AC
MVDLEEQFTEIFRRHHEAVWRYCARRVGPDAAFDVAADSFLIAWRRLGEVPAGGGDVLPWLLGVARKVVANEQRRRRRGDRLVAKLGQFARAPAPVSGNYPDAGMALPDLVTAMRTLSLRDQEALQLVGWDGLSASEAARVVGCSPSAMANRIRRARQRLETALDVSGERGVNADRNAPPHGEGVAYEN